MSQRVLTFHCYQVQKYTEQNINTVFSVLNTLHLKEKSLFPLALIEHVLNPSDTCAPLQKVFPPT